MNLVIPDHPWSEKGASLRISMTGAKKGHGEGKLGQIVTEVKSDNLEDPSESIHFKWHLGQIFDDLRIGVNITTFLYKLP
ncbi:hypothetical protein [Aphanizomenon sp. UHCC 0183]|uniref:hypothetical protein n=1 Tax=Aphanizomenon sp. UHCC 0183 TaxID=2590028 RepID=UPI001445EA05|nr:hypothetical protein [Aphanizomenon sp. UHCC 0183]